MADTAAVLAAAQEALSATIGDTVVLSAPADLGGSPRSTVLRVAVQGAGELSSAVVKAHLDGGPWETLVREPAALELLAGVGAPRLLAVAHDPPLVVMADLGSAPTDLAGLLLGEDPGAAVDGLQSWAGSLGRLHSATAGRRTEIRAGLARHAERLGRPAPAEDDMPAALDEAASKLAGLLPQLGVQRAAEALDVVRRLQDLLTDDASSWALTPGDICPDNNVLTAVGAVLLDFEGAAFRHVAWDAAYLRVPWPSCWCSWALPPDVAAGALGAWRDAVSAAVPVVLAPTFDGDLAVAEAGWAAISTAWFLERALDDGQGSPGDAGRPDAGVHSPSRRALVQHRLSRVAAGTDPRLTPWRSVAAQAAGLTRERWGELPLLLAPAFRRRG